MKQLKQSISFLMLHRLRERASLELFTGTVLARYAERSVNF
jgi:hypothetical protein